MNRSILSVFLGALLTASWLPTAESAPRDSARVTYDFAGSRGTYGPNVLEASTARSIGRLDGMRVALRKLGLGFLASEISPGAQEPGKREIYDVGEDGFQVQRRRTDTDLTKRVIQGGSRGITVTDSRVENIVKGGETPTGRLMATMIRRTPIHVITASGTLARGFTTSSRLLRAAQKIRRGGVDSVATVGVGRWSGVPIPHALAERIQAR